MNQKDLIEDSIKFSPDSKRDNEIVYLLRQMNISEALTIIIKMLDQESPNTYYVACKVLNEIKVAESFFVFGLTKADASNIKLWLEFAIPRMGVKRVITALKNTENEKPGTIDKALYWLPSLIKKEDFQIIEELKRDWQS
jgi:hypothetical protein